MPDVLQEIRDLVVQYKNDEIVSKVEKAVEQGLEAEQILQEGLIAAMDQVGEKYSSGEMFIPEMLASAKTMKQGLEVIKPKLLEGGNAPSSKGVIVIGTVKDDIHDIGKNLVLMMMEGAGFEVHDLGIDNPPENFVNKVKEVNAQVLGMSALLTTTMPNMKETIKMLEEEGLGDKVYTIVGGAPVSQQYAKDIGANGYAADAATAVDVVKGWLQG